MSEWPENLKPGDRVIVHTLGWGDRIEIVDSVTENRVTIRDGLIFDEFGRATNLLNKVTGSVRVYEATPEAIREIEEAEQREQLVGDLNEIWWDDLPTNKLQEILKIARGGE